MHACLDFRMTAESCVPTKVGLLISIVSPNKGVRLSRSWDSLHPRLLVVIGWKFRFVSDAETRIPCSSGLCEDPIRIVQRHVP